jgi:potassium-transporting ATPase KdpC subunit
VGPRSSHAPEPSFRNQLRPAIAGVFVLTLVTGVIFPLLLFVITRPLFPYQAKGSLVARGGVAAGSGLVGQDFTGPEYFHPRPSAAGAGYDGMASGGTNLAPDNRKLIEGDRSFAGIRQLAGEYRKSNNLAGEVPIPIDAVTRSGSGLDPDISPENAALQTARVARARGLSEDTVRQIVTDRTRQPQFGILGNPRVSVLELNLALDALASAPSSP